MKPKPFVSLNHFTVPVAIRISPLVRLRSAGPAPSSPATVRAFVYRAARRWSREHPVSRTSAPESRGARRNEADRLEDRDKNRRAPAPTPRSRWTSASRTRAGHVADRTDEHLARLGAVGGPGDALP